MTGGVRCSVFKCNSQQKKQQVGEQLSFFRYPKNPQTRKIWLERCGQQGIINPDCARVCSLHFNLSDFQRDLRAELLNTKQKKNLVTGGTCFIYILNNYKVL